MVKGSDDNLRPEDQRFESSLRRDASFGGQGSTSEQAFERRFETYSDEHKSSDEIRAEIERTRAELDRTVDELQARLSPEQLVHTVFDAIRDQASDAVRSVTRAVRENPIPLVLIGIGVAWLVSTQIRKSTRSSRDLEHYEYNEYEGLGQCAHPAI